MHTFINSILRHQGGVDEPPRRWTEPYSQSRILQRNPKPHLLLPSAQKAALTGCRYCQSSPLALAKGPIPRRSRGCNAVGVWKHNGKAEAPASSCLKRATPRTEVLWSENQGFVSSPQP